MALRKRRSSSFASTSVTLAHLTRSCRADLVGLASRHESCLFFVAEGPAYQHLARGAVLLFATRQDRPTDLGRHPVVALQLLIPGVAHVCLGHGLQIIHGEQCRQLREQTVERPSRQRLEDTMFARERDGDGVDRKLEVDRSGRVPGDARELLALDEEAHHEPSCGAQEGAQERGQQPVGIHRRASIASGTARQEAGR